MSRPPARLLTRAAVARMLIAILMAGAGLSISLLSHSLVYDGLPLVRCGVVFTCARMQKRRKQNARQRVGVRLSAPSSTALGSSETHQVVPWGCAGEARSSHSLPQLSLARTSGHLVVHAGAYAVLMVPRKEADLGKEKRHEQPPDAHTDVRRDVFIVKGLLHEGEVDELDEHGHTCSV